MPKIKIIKAVKKEFEPHLNGKRSGEGREKELEERAPGAVPEEREAGKPKRERISERKERDREKLEKLREEFKGLKKKIETEKRAERAPFKDFEDYFTVHNRIELPEEISEELEKRTDDFQKQNKFRGPRILTGNKTATEYDSRVENFSTKTTVDKLPSGEKIFVVDSYPASLLHRFGDSVLRRLTGVKNFKSPNRIWKETFEQRSNIPVIKLANKNAVAMPYIENVNLRDLMTFNKEIKNWGPVEWAQKTDFEEKKKIVRSVTREMEKVHRQNKTWGEAILANMIIDKNKKVWICDPEVLFYKEVPKIEQKASDLKDIIFTTVTALAHSENLTDFREVVDLVFGNYSDKEVVKTAVEAAKKKPTTLQKLFFIYTKNRYGLKDLKQHEEIREAIAEYQPEENSKKERKGKVA